MLFVESVFGIREREIGARPAETPLHLFEVGRNRNNLIEVSQAEDVASVGRHYNGVCVTPVLYGSVAVASAPQRESREPTVGVGFGPVGG